MVECIHSKGSQHILAIPGFGDGEGLRVTRNVDYLEDVSSNRARVRARFAIEGGIVMKMTVQLEILHDGNWKPARRYDDAHGSPHLDVLDREGNEYGKVWLDISRNEAVTLVLRNFVMRTGSDTLTNSWDGKPMAKYLNITDEERAEARRRIENFFAFTRDVLDDPSILDKVPNGSHVAAIPLDERVPGVCYDVETPHTVAIVTPPPAPRARRAAPTRARGNEPVRRRRPARSTAGRPRDARRRDARRFQLTATERSRA